MIKRAIQMVVPKAGGARAATDHRSDQYDRWRIVADSRTPRGLASVFTCGFPMILPDL
jgi:hypothetical protein